MQVYFTVNVRKKFGTQAGVLFIDGVRLIYTLFQNDRHFSIHLFTCKLALVNSFLNSNSKEYFGHFGITCMGSSVIQNETNYI